MKIIRCRPILIDIEDQDYYPIIGINQELGGNKDKKLTLIYGNSDNSLDFKYKQIILINSKFNEDPSNEYHDVIVTQSQLPLKYIKDFINEYNQYGSMDDLDIVVDDKSYPILKNECIVNTNYINKNVAEQLINDAYVFAAYSGGTKEKQAVAIAIWVANLLYEHTEDPEYWLNISEYLQSL